MRILFLNPFHGGSHAAVAEGYIAHSRHEITLLALSQAGGWRWRMRGAAVTLAQQVRGQGSGSRDWETTHNIQHDQQRKTQSAKLKPAFDLILATDMLDLATFLGLSRDVTHGIPTALYFHENQLTYPLPSGRKPDLSLPWINYSSALAADALLFNSDFHRRTFLAAVPRFIGRYHDHQELDLVDSLATKARVLYPGVDLGRLEQKRADAGGEAATKESPRPPIVLWNSRWEYDKQPEAFFAALAELERRGVDFRVIVAGEHIDPRAAEFVAARARFGARALAWGYAPDLAAYRALLHQADIVVSTALQEFFGISVIEAMYCGCVPVLPRRLSYPEIIPPEYHDMCLYDDHDDLIATLIAAMQVGPEQRAQAFPNIVAHYDWSQMAARWDDALAAIAQTGRTTSDE